MTLTESVPISELGKDAKQRVAEWLRAHKNAAWTVSGIMVGEFDVRREDIADKPFRDWPRGIDRHSNWVLSSLYSAIRKAAEALVSERKARKTKRGRAVLYWWVS